MKPAVRYLAIETSSPQLSLAAGDDERILAQYQGPLAWRHADTLFEGLQKLLGKLHWKPQSLTGVAVSVGPGSFTGIRIGLSAARALGQALHIPVVGVPSLQTMALGTGPQVRWVSPLIDALQGKVFTGLYERKELGALRVIQAETHVPIEVWVERLKAKKLKDLWITGDAARVYAAALQKLSGWKIAPPETFYPRASVLLERARPPLRQAKAGSYKNVFPLYLRPPAMLERRLKRS
jgi:tRNA threonylcarbamoyladenosine biosynthesis protein TsaB